MNEIIETMANALADTLEHGDTFYYVDDVVAILRAAKAEGWELCRLPGKFGTPIGNRHEIRGYYACLDDIDRCQLHPDNHSEPMSYEQLIYPTTDPVIAAEPDLYHALDTLIAVVGLTPVAGNLEALQEAVDVGVDALAKARGKS